jgi:lipopolysaccharide/colanic/teichoic acid biosynthesis glycosyltransferase
MPSLAATYDPDFVAERLSVRPGCTGLWQVSPDATGLIGEHPEYDEHYVRNHTVRLDLWVLAATIRMVFTRHAGDDLGCIPNWTGAALAQHLDER